MIFFLKKNKRNKTYTYQQLALVTCMAFLVIFLSCSIISFCPYDRSFFYKTVATTSFYYNWCGWYGAYIASIMLFLFGGIGSLLCVGFIFFLLFIMLSKRLFKEEVDRIFIFMGLLLTCTAGLHFLNVDIITKKVPGGIVGDLLHTMLAKIFDPFLLGLFLLVMALSSLVLITGLSGFVTFGKLLCALFLHEKFKRTLIDSFYLAFQIISYPFKKFVTFVLGLWPHANNTIHDSLATFDFEHEFDQLGDDEEFWKSFGVQEPFKDEQIASPALLLQNDDLQAEDKKIEVTIGKQKKVVPELQNEKPYQAPSLALFKSEPDNQKNALESHKILAAILEEKLERFGIQGHVTAINVGPVITLFEYQPEIDSKISKIIALEDDLALALQALSIRIIAPIPGRSVVGFEVSNKQRRMVLLGQVLQSKDFKNFTGHLPLVLGQDSIGSTVIVDLAAMPHLLIAGSTGSGKSVALNSMLVSLLCKHSPETLKLILIDPKRLEFASYADIPHLLVPIVTDPRKASLVLKWVVKTMEERYALMESCNVRNIFDYHTLARSDTERPSMPFIVIMIDELSDLMMTAPKETEDLIARITQMARAAGIHMIVATQRPSVDVITGLIKVNFPSRISFRVTSKIDSRTILDCSGADKLLGKGDMLFLDSSSHLKRAHAAYVSDHEIEKLVTYIRGQRSVQYIDLSLDCVSRGNDDDVEIDDQLYHDVLRFIESIDKVSISLLQRKFRIGYNRSARIIDRLESQGIIMQDPDGKTRKVIR